LEELPVLISIPHGGVAVPLEIYGLESEVMA
jgi:hypothetical protein